MAAGRSIPRFPPDISKAFALVSTWETDLRYQAGTAKRRDADAFLQAVEKIIIWADGNSVSLRVRIVDPDFAGTSKADRHDAAWKYLENLPDELQSQISLLLLLAPDETETSFANLEFDHPIPSQI